MLSILPFLMGCDVVSPPDTSAPLSTAPSSSAFTSASGVAAVQGNLGGLVRVDPPSELSPASVRVRVLRDGTWSTACSGTLRCYLSSPAVQVQAIGAGGLWRSRVVTPDPIAATLQGQRSDGAWWADESVDLLLRAPTTVLPLGKVAGLYLQRTDTASWWTGADDAWSDRPVMLPPGAHSVSTDADAPEQLMLRALLAAPPDGWTIESISLRTGRLTEGRGPLGDALSTPLLPLADSTETVTLLGRTLLWGDVHAHSDLSHDACKNIDEGCANTAEDVGWGFFDSAVDQGLDFAAMTDHAEWTDWWESADATTSVDIWERQAAVVDDAEATWSGKGFIPIIGYEWTAVSELDESDGVTWHGGHRTVLLEDPGDCTDARVAASGRTDDASHSKLSAGPTYTGSNDVVAKDIAALVDALDDATDSCGLDSRILTIPHHPAWDPPSPIDWDNTDNAPDARYEMLLEIHSEHGSSECIDPDTEHCDWRPRPRGNYVPSGSAQAALLHGYRFGFVGGTDSHDAKPGTVDDDPSCTAFWAPEDESLRCHEWTGALTGVLADESGDRAALFDGMTDRNTYATSGPRLPVRAWVEDASGTVYLPGDDVPADGGSLLVVSVEGLVEHLDYTEVAIDLLDAGGELLETSDDLVLTHELSAAAGEVRYARLRLIGAPDADGTEDDGERIWLSPWFFDEP